MAIQMIHNNYCTKSVCAFDLVKEKNIPVEVIDYMKNRLSADDLVMLLKKLGIPAENLVRKAEPVFVKKYQGKALSEEEWIQAMVDHPILIERPIFINGDKAVIGRPAERIFEII